MKLFYSPAACSLASHIVLREADLPFDLEKVDLATKKTESGLDFTTISKKGYVPALILDNGDLLTEGVAIMLWAAGQSPGKKLAPQPGTMDYIRLIEWMAFIATELHKGFGPLFNKAIPDDTKAALKTRLFTRLAHADAETSGRQYVVGENFGIADVYLFTVLGWLRFIDVNLNQWPNLAAFSAHIAERPAVKAALSAEGLA